ncbi:MAG: hypothetical protein H7X94_11825 [Vallitaleaceae bacterium]|nr:hypothetical protein [Vallitaleaceae bacterium]
MVEIQFEADTSISGILLYDGAVSEDQLSTVQIEFSNGRTISKMEFINVPGEPSIANFEPMKVKWIKIRNNDPNKTSGALSEIILQ